MKRINELKQMSDDDTKEVCTTTAIETVINNKYNNNELQNQDNTLKNQIAEEKAARIFPLNILSNKLKLKDANAIKGRQRSYVYL